MAIAIFPMVTSSSKDLWGDWAASTFLMLAGFPWGKAGQFLAICPFFQHCRQSPSFMQCSLSFLVSLATFIASTSIVFRSLAGVVEVAVKGR